MIGDGLVGRTALVTGAAHGIGAAIADTLAEEGASVLRVDRLAADGVDALDAGDTAAVRDYLADRPGVDVLVNCAGGVVGQTHVPVEDVTDEAWQAVIDANLRSSFVCSRAVAAGMKQRGWGRIVMISSGAGRSVSLTGIQAYTTAKAAQIGLTRQLAHELGPHGVTVNCIAPGFVLSNPSTIAQWDSYGEQGQTDLLAGIPLRRLGRSQDIADGVRFFTSTLADWVTGQVLPIDGGHALY